MTEQNVEGAATAPASDEQNAEQQVVDATDWKAEARKWQTRAKENKSAADRLAALEESQKTEQQKVTERAEAAERRAAEAEQRAMRLQVIAETGLPTNLHKFVVGSTEDELRANASELLAQFSADQRSVDVGLGPRNTPTPVGMTGLIRKAAGRA